MFEIAGRVITHWTQTWLGTYLAAGFVASSTLFVVGFSLTVPTSGSASALIGGGGGVICLTGLFALGCLLNERRWPWFTTVWGLRQRTVLSTRRWQGTWLIVVWFAILIVIHPSPTNPVAGFCSTVLVLASVAYLVARPKERVDLSGLSPVATYLDRRTLRRKKQRTTEI